MEFSISHSTILGNTSYYLHARDGVMIGKLDVFKELGRIDPRHCTYKVLAINPFDDNTCFCVCYDADIALLDSNGNCPARIELV